MNFLNLVFYIFIFLFFICYFIVPQKNRYIVIAIGSYIFYGFTSIKMLLVLMLITLITYVGGLALGKNKKKGVYALFFAAILIILIIFKYTNFIVQNINLLIEKMGMENTQLGQINILLPVGLSFIVFQACTYLGDVYRKNFQPERNIIKYAAFVAFFPTVLSGPIQKARNLLPQISRPAPFDGEMAKKGTIIFVWGLFEKIMVANKLSVIVNQVFNDYQNYNSAYYIVAGICFSLYIYADFSSYSDMARGISMIMGIQIGKNFNNPYLSCSTSEFWNRWHVSLNEWFLENIYIPLGGNRRGVVRKYINVFIVFAVSGLWHGASYHFIIWGIVNGILVIIGQILKPVKKSIYKAINVSEDVESIKFCKQAIVFWLITLTWVFFNNGTRASLHIIKNMVLFNPINFFDQNLLSISGTVATTVATMLFTVVFVIIQIKRQNEVAEYKKYARQPLLFQAGLIGLLICICIFGACSTDAAVNTQFLYFQF